MAARKRSVLLFLLALSSLHGTAPDSLVGKIFRERTAAPMFHSSYEKTTALDENGRARNIYNGANPLLSEAGLAVHDPLPDRTYTYTRTGENSALLQFTNGVQSSPDLYYLTFTTDTSGAIEFVSLFGGSFELSEQTSLQNIPLSNASLRGRVGPGQSLIAGFVISGTRSREVLIRVSGPALASFGVADTWADPDFQIFSGNVKASRLEVHYADWSKPTLASSPRAGFEKIFAFLGAFPFAADSKDAAEIVRLPPGAYTIVATPPAGDRGGETLIETYVLPE